MSNKQNDEIIENIYEQLDEIEVRLADLKIQAMMFDMDIDIETWSLTPKRKDERPQWLIRHLERDQDNAANSPEEAGWYGHKS